jgi:hypothetical protein
MAVNDEDLVARALARFWDDGDVALIPEAAAAFCRTVGQHEPSRPSASGERVPPLFAERVTCAVISLGSYSKDMVAPLDLATAMYTSIAKDPALLEAPLLFQAGVWNDLTACQCLRYKHNADISLLTDAVASARRALAAAKGGGAQDLGSYFQTVVSTLRDHADATKTTVELEEAWTLAIEGVTIAEPSSNAKALLGMHVLSMAEETQTSGRVDRAIEIMSHLIEDPALDARARTATALRLADLIRQHAMTCRTIEGCQHARQILMGFLERVSETDAAYEKLEDSLAVVDGVLASVSFENGALGR